MAQAAGIANVVIPVEQGPKSSSTEILSKRNQKQSTDSSNPLNETEDSRVNSRKTNTGDEDSSAAPFSKVLKEKLDKKDRNNPKEKSQAEDNQDQTLSAGLLSGDSILLKDKSTEKKTRQIVVQKVSLTPTKTAPTAANARSSAAASSISTEGHAKNTKTQGQISKNSIKQDTVRENISPADGNQNRSASVKNEIPSAVTESSANRPGVLKESVSSFRTAEKQSPQTGQALSTQTQGQAISSQARPSSRSEINTVQPSQIESTIKTASSVTHDTSSTYESNPEGTSKQNKAMAASKGQGIHENTGQKAAETPLEGFRQVSSAVLDPSPSRVPTQTTAVNPASSSGPSTSEASAPLSAAQQVLRGIQTSADGEVRTIQVALSPAGLGMVRIQLQREGEEISGVLEVQKAETRREIEKTLPQIISALDSQGLQVRRIEVSSMPNSNQKQQTYDGNDNWALHHEMYGQGHSDHRTGTPSDNEFTSEPALEIVNHSIKRGYDSSEESKNLNLFA